jgi:periplasmic protein TonB
MRLLAGVTLALGLAVSLVAQQVYTPGDGVSLPTVIKQVRAGYTEKAMNARIEGNVALDAVVLADGKVGDVTVIESLDEGLDQQAIESLKQWEFKPGLKDGEPVAVRVRVIISFRLT